MKFLSIFAAATLMATAHSSTAAEYPGTDPIVPFSIDNRVVLGDPDFEKISSLPSSSRISQLSRGVAHLQISGSVCTGFLIDSDLLMTNEHCVVQRGREVSATNIQVFMDYYRSGDRGALSAVGQEYVLIDKNLDFAVVRLNRRLGERYPILSLSPSIPSEMRSVKVIQHPKGRSKEVSRRNSRVVRLMPRQNVVHYRADTQGGSSGSPVFDLNGDAVIALHHVGSPSGGFNEGVLMSSIIERMQQAATTSPVTANAEWNAAVQLAQGGRPLTINEVADRYSIGSTMNFKVNVPASGYLNIFNVTQTGESTVLFPNRFVRDNRVRQGSMTFPTSAMPFQLTASAPTGDQLILVMLTQQPLNAYSDSGESKSPFARMSPASFKSFTRSARSSDYFAGVRYTSIVR
ncbi:MAG: trypsin-like peptidase domain-containing protein [Pseudomonadota bacterium]